MRHVRAANEESGSRVAETLRPVVHAAVVLILAACATLDGARGEVSGVTWDVVDVRGSDGRAILLNIDFVPERHPKR
jgi:hypothetical protein